MMKRILFMLIIVLSFGCSACKKAEQSLSPEQMMYTNLDSKTAMEEVKEILLAAMIDEEFVDTVLTWVTDYNNCMRDCESFSLAGDFMTVDGDTVDYGDYL